MKQRFIWMIAAILTLSGTLVGLTSCRDNDDNSVLNPLADKLIGMWISEFETQGTIGEGDDAVEYYKVVQIVDFDNDKEGLWAKYYINQAKEVITLEGGYFFGSFNYRTNADGKIIIDVTSDNNNIVEADHWTMQFADGHITGKDGDESYDLTPATEAQKEQIKLWGQSVGFGYDGGDANYNINSDPEVMENFVFDRTNWLQHTHILMRVTSDVNNRITDKYERTGYQEFVLPWAKDKNGNPESMISNLPDKFCDDLTPENGWDMVANFCGRYNYPNANYIVFYNKWTGVMRYFYYIPEDARLNGASDHNWEIMMGNGAAEHTPFRYATPMDTKIKSPERISAKNNGYWSQFVTPWCSKDKFGQMSPQTGWYAFDVDLSVYRGTGNTMKTDRFIIPVIRGYHSANVDLYGSINADITGDVNLEKSCVNTSNGVFGPMEDLLGNVKDIKEFIGNAKDVYENIMKGDVLGAIEGGIGVAKQGCDLVGIDYGKTEEGFDGYKGTVNLKLSGTIDMKGKITDANVIKGPTNLNMAIKEFDFADTHLGEGVWNLETAPVVYYTNAQLQWREDYTKSWDLFHGWKEYEVTLTGKNSPFGAKKQALIVNGEKEYNTSKDPWCGYVNYFDPSSIKVVLNPNLFTAEEIASAQVYATCGVRKANSAFGSVDNYRAAFGLTGSKISIDKKNGGEYYNRPHDEAPFDALSSSQDKHDMKTVAKFDATKYDGYNCGMFGRGDSEYILEPQPLSGDDHELCTYMPSYEVTVTVIVNHNGKPIVYSRTYLPEYKKMNVADIPNVDADYIKQHKPANYVEAIYTQQMNHVGDIYKWTRRTLQPNRGLDLNYGITILGQETWEFDKLSESWPQLFDGDPSTKWCANKRARGEFVHNMTKSIWAEVKTNYAVSPTGYTLTTANDNAVFHSRRPRVWHVWGSTKGYDWVLLAEESTSTSAGSPTEKALPHTSLTSVNYKFNKGEAKNFQYFLIEINDNWDSEDDSFIQLAEFQFTYPE